MKIQSAMNTSFANNVRNHKNITEAKVSKTSKQLASGKKVNSAADDAVALSISKKLMKEASALKAGSNNISYGRDAVRIADGALSNITDSLGDMEQNTVRAMNGLYSESDRNILQNANKQSVETINHTINQAKYNEKNLLDGSTGDINIFTGAGSSTIKESDAKAIASELENFDISGNPDMIKKDALDKAYSSVSAMRSKLGAEENGLTAAFNANNNTAENLTAAQSRKEDTDYAKAIMGYKANKVVGAAQDMVLKNQMNSQENLINKLL